MGRETDENHAGRVNSTHTLEIRGMRREKGGENGLKNGVNPSLRNFGTRYAISAGERR